MTSLELKALWLLAGAPETPVPAADLTLQLWGTARGRRGNLYVLLHGLRQKLGRSAAAPTIVTRHGFGFKLTAGRVRRPEVPHS